MKTSQFTNQLIWFNSMIPLLILGWDYSQQQLGPNAVNTAIHITGIVSLVLLLLSLLITPLIRLTQKDEWILFRKTFGLCGFLYALTHLSIYFLFDREASLTSLWQEMTQRRFLVIGTIAFVMLLPLVATSTAKMRQRLGLRKWKRLHRLAYLIAALAVLHYYLQVKSDTRIPIAFAVVLSALLGSRLSIQGWSPFQNVSARKQKPNQNAERFWSGQLELIDIKQESHDVRTFRFINADSTDLAFKFKPGQFLTLNVSIGSKTERRSYTIASSPHQKQWIELTIKKQEGGLVSNYLHDVARAGDLISARGPYGKFIFTGNLSRSVILIAGGVGITPLLSILRYLHHVSWQGNISLLVSAKTQNDLLFTDEIGEISKSLKNMTVHTTLTREESNSWHGRRGRIDQSIIQNITENEIDAEVFVCGPKSMADAIDKMLANTEIPTDRIYRESFGRAKSTAIDNLRTKSLTIQFARSNRDWKTSQQDTILTSAEKCKVPIESDCRSGICGQCMVRLIKGDVSMDCDAALSAKDKKNKMVLACQAVAESDLIVDA